jgi:ABC-type branched-subunit amino acid transport system ATPase component
MMLGRAGERATLRGALEDARAGTARCLLLVGDAGMGKTTLLRSVEEQARPAGFTVVRTASPEGAELCGYGVVEDVARALLPLAAHRTALAARLVAEQQQTPTPR